MTGLDLRRYVEYSGLTMSDIARELDTSPQNIRSKMTKERVDNDFVEKVRNIVSKCAPPLSTEVQHAMLGNKRLYCVTGEGLKQRLKMYGISLSYVAACIGTSPQNLGAKLNRKSVKLDFAQKVEDVIQKYKEEIGLDSNFSLEQPGSSEDKKPSTVLESVLKAKVERLENENSFLRKQVETLLAIVGQK
jgi:transcriptional regulator with XRE-family HTH domain|nr:MAG TPA: helix-turn-helix domain protein [Caudoviricetes sp.]